MNNVDYDFTSCSIQVRSMASYSKGRQLDIFDGIKTQLEQV
jgi:hypothetical protein